MPVLFRLLYSTGMRTTETRELRRCDVNLDNGVISIVNTKGYEQHYVVMHDSMTALMRKYDTAIETLYPSRVYFFPNGINGFRNSSWVSKAFRYLWGQTGAPHSTAYELRHNYAVENINKLVDAGMLFKDSLTYVSKSMGHTSSDITAKYYYSLVPVLADIIQEQTEAGFNDLIPEVSL
jgi:integrase